MSTVAIDFDGVIHRYSKGWHDGTIYDDPVPGAMQAIATLMGEHAVFVHTTRDTLAVAGWLAKWGAFDTRVDTVINGPVFWNDKDALLITNRKLPAIAYIDDRGVTFTGDWNAAMAAVRQIAADGVAPVAYAPQPCQVAAEGFASLPRRVRDKRDRFHLTFREAAAQAGVGTMVLYRLEKDDAPRMSVPVALKLLRWVDGAELDPPTGGETE